MLLLSFEIRYRGKINNSRRVLRYSSALRDRVTRPSYFVEERYVAKHVPLRALSLCSTPATATSAAAMDLFVFYPPSSVLICKPCGYAVPPTSLSTHIAVHHINDARHAATNSTTRAQLSSRSTKPAKLLASYLLERYQLLNPATTTIPTPLATEPPIPELQVYRGYQCTCCSFVRRSEAKEAINSMRQHFNRLHRLVPAKSGRPAKITDIPAKDSGPLFCEVYCQRFFVSGAQSSFFTVNVLDQVQELVKSRPRGHADVFRALIDEQGTAGNGAQDARAQIYNS
jgi:hypothetical protein